MTDYAISRDSRRVPLETRVHLRFERFSGFISEYSSNVSPGGIFVKTQAPSPVGTLLDFEFQLGDGYPLIKGTGEVVWIRSEDLGPSHPAGMGIRFLRLSKGSRDLIYRMVDEYIQQGGVPFDVERGPGSAAAGTAVVVDGEAPADDASAETSPPAPVSAAPDPALAALSLPDLAARSFGPPPGPVVAPAAVPPAEPVPDGVPLSSYGAGGSSGGTGRTAAIGVGLLLVVALAAAAFVFQEPLMRRLGLLGKDRANVAAAASPVASRAAAAEPATPTAVTAPALPASDDAIPEPYAAAEGGSGAAPAAVATLPSLPAAPPPPDATRRLTAIRSIDWRQVDGETEVIIRGDGPIAAGGYGRDRLEGAAPREVLRIRGVERPFGRARLPVGSPHLKQVRTGHHTLAGGDELHLVFDLADSGVVVRAVREVDGALVVRFGPG